MKNRVWICYYINSRGDERQKIFDDLDAAITKIQAYIDEQGDDEFIYDYAICNEYGETLADWKS